MLVAPVIEIPCTNDAPVLDNVLIVFKLKVIVGEVLLQVIPVTLPPAPEDTKLFRILLETVRAVALLNEELIEIPVIAACPAKLVSVLVERTLVPFQ